MRMYDPDEDNNDTDGSLGTTTTPDTTPTPTAPEESNDKFFKVVGIFIVVAIGLMYFLSR